MSLLWLPRSGPCLILKNYLLQAVFPALTLEFLHLRAIRDGKYLGGQRKTTVWTVPIESSLQLFGQMIFYQLAERSVW